MSQPCARCKTSQTPARDREAKAGTGCPASIHLLGSGQARRPAQCTWHSPCARLRIFSEICREAKHMTSAKCRISETFVVPEQNQANRFTHSANLKKTKSWLEDQNHGGKKASSRSIEKHKGFCPSGQNPLCFTSRRDAVAATCKTQ